MVAVLEHHVPGVAAGHVLPVLAADVLPAGHLGEHQQAQLVAGVQEVVGLGVMAGAHRVALELVLENLRVVALDRGGHGVAHIGVALVPVQAPDFQLLPVEEEAVLRKPGGAEAEADPLHIQHSPGGVLQRRLQGVEGGAVGRPGLRAGDGAGEVADRILRPGRAGKDGLTCTVQDGQAHRVRQGAVLQRQVHQGPVQLRGADKHVGQEGGLLHLQVRLPVEAAEGHVVDDVAEGGLVQGLPGVQPDGHPVLLSILHQAGQLHGKGGVAAVVAGRLLAVDKHGGLVGRALKGEKEPFALPRLRHVKAAAVAAHHLVVVLVGVVEGEHLAGVGQPHHGALPPAVEKRLVKCLGKRPVVVPRDALCQIHLPLYPVLRGPARCRRRLISSIAYHKISPPERRARERSFFSRNPSGVCP